MTVHCSEIAENYEWKSSVDQIQVNIFVLYIFPTILAFDSVANPGFFDQFHFYQNGHMTPKYCAPRQPLLNIMLVSCFVLC